MALRRIFGYADQSTCSWADESQTFRQRPRVPDRGKLGGRCRRSCAQGRIGSFYSSDRDEPPHVHVERDENEAKFWLRPVILERSGGFGRQELRKIEALVANNAEALLRSWNECFKG